MKTIAFVLTLLTATAAGAQTPDVAGHWTGALDIQGQTLRLDVDLARNASGQLVGAATSADARNIPLTKIALEGSSVTFFARSDQPFTGTLAADGRSISGNIRLDGYDLPLELTRTGDAALEPPPTSPAISKTLEGRWTGTLATTTGSHRVELVLANGPDGRSSGYFVSVDEGGLMLYVQISEQPDGITLRLTGVNATYTAAMDAAGATLTGTFAERGTSLPLVLTR